jgi:putative aldouronate transport system permease protein
MPTMVIMLILRSGSIMSVGFEKVYLMQNDLTLSVSEVISTYTYKMGILSQRFSYSSAIGLFNNTINFAFLTAVNYISKKLTDTSLW